MRLVVYILGDCFLGPIRNDISPLDSHHLVHDDDDDDDDLMKMRKRKRECC